MKEIKTLKESSGQLSNCSSTASKKLNEEKAKVSFLKENREFLYEILSGSLSSVANEIMAEIEFSDDSSQTD